MKNNKLITLAQIFSISAVALIVLLIPLWALQLIVMGVPLVGLITLIMCISITTIVLILSFLLLIAAGVLYIVGVTTKQQKNTEKAENIS